jgi:hypothetical protein
MGLYGFIAACGWFYVGYQVYKFASAMNLL